MDIDVDLISKIDIVITPKSLNLGTIDIKTIPSNIINVEIKPSKIQIQVTPQVQDPPRKIDVVISKSNLKGDPGGPGMPGEKGEGVPLGGKKDQVLSKKSTLDYDTHWIDNTGNTYVPPVAESGSIIRDSNGLISSIVLESKVVSIVRDVNGLISGVNNSSGISYEFTRINGRISSWEVG